MELTNSPISSLIAAAQTVMDDEIVDEEVMESDSVSIITSACDDALADEFTLPGSVPYQQLPPLSDHNVLSYPQEVLSKLSNARSMNRTLEQIFADAIVPPELFGGDSSA
ncbi:Uncharacterized protein PBTT_05417 [Plasmodiophora brassicae]